MSYESTGIVISYTMRIWREALKDHLDAIKDNFHRRMTATIDRSTGIVKFKSAKGLVVVDEVERWKSEFGADIAEGMAALVRAEMDGYSWIRERRLRDTWRARAREIVQCLGC
jgi:hypothetical protein